MKHKNEIKIKENERKKTGAIQNYRERIEKCEDTHMQFYVDTQ